MRAMVGEGAVTVTMAKFQFVQDRMGLRDWLKMEEKSGFLWWMGRNKRYNDREDEDDFTLGDLRDRQAERKYRGVIAEPWHY